VHWTQNPSVRGFSRTGCCTRSPRLLAQYIVLGLIQFSFTADSYVKINSQSLSNTSNDTLLFKLIIKRDLRYQVEIYQLIFYAGGL